MLEQRLLRTNAAAVAEQLKKKYFTLDVELFNSLESQRKELQQHSEELQAQRNRSAKEIGQAKAKGQDVQPLLDAVGDLGDKLTVAKQKLSEVQTSIDDFINEIPNLPDAEVPEGKKEDQNIEISRWGTPKNFAFEIKDHVDIGEQLEGLDFEVAAKMTGSRFVVMKRNIARMHRALIQFMLDTHIDQHGYQEIYTPFIVNSDSLYGTGQLPKFAEDSFKLDVEQNYYLIPTAEVPVTNTLRGEIYTGQLPLKYTCHTPCFRSEAGSYGRDIRGLIRQHQFEKVELVQFVKPSESNQALETLTNDAEAILQALELPYRKVLLCGGDLGFSAAKTYDLEVWVPSQETYREISSCSNFRDFQSRRMQTRYRNTDNKPELLHTLNGSGLAAGRALVAILENYQCENGSVDVPTVLQPYMHGLTKITK